MSLYIIWNPSSELPPKATFENRSDAIRVAGAMANRNVNDTFYVCKLVNSARGARYAPVPPVVYVDLEKAVEF